jgi:hypothetical protein
MTMLSEIFIQSHFCRTFELEVAKAIKDKLITLPTYLSVGQETIPATLAKLFPNYKVFAQHRCHSYYLCFGGSPKDLARELLELPNYMNGMCGSASIYIPDKMFGHDGLLGSNAPIAVGYAEATQQPVLCVLGDAAAEEDYVLGAIGRAATTKAPVLFIIEDNNLSIATEKKFRRKWNVLEVAESLGVAAFDGFNGQPHNIISSLGHPYLQLPALMNIRCCRHLWHAGAGQDSEPEWDCLSALAKDLPESASTYIKKNNIYIQDLWKTLRQEKECQYVTQ